MPADGKRSRFHRNVNLGSRLEALTTELQATVLVPKEVAARLPCAMATSIPRTG